MAHSETEFVPKIGDDSLLFGRVDWLFVVLSNISMTRCYQAPHRTVLALFTHTAPR